MNQYKHLDEERKTRSNLKRKYTKVPNAFLGMEFFLANLELGMVGTSVALPVIIPVSAPISVALTTCSAILKSVSRLLTKKSTNLSCWRKLN